MPTGTKRPGTAGTGDRDPADKEPKRTAAGGRGKEKDEAAGCLLAAGKVFGGCG